MTSLKKLSDRGLVETLLVHGVCVNDDGRVTSVSHNAGNEGDGRGHYVSLYFRRCEVRGILVHYGAVVVCREDVSKLQKHVDAILKEDWCIYYDHARGLWDSQPDHGQNSVGWQKTTRLEALKFEAECLADDSLNRGTY
jgi:hypothetical protein